MSWLFPLYLAGLLAVSLPLVFHLIRRAPKGELPYSSLMFLEPSPPRLTRRSRLDNLVLLLLRALALILLALAFTRPFFRQAAYLDLGGQPPRRIAILLDASASMKRAGAWDAAKEEVDRTLRETRPGDLVALYAFADGVQTIVSLEDSAEVPPAQRAALVRQRLESIGPGWGATNLGEALVFAADALHAAGDDEDTSAATERQLVVVSDLQRGSNIEALQSYQWPAEVQTAVKRVKAARTANAGLELLASDGASDDIDNDPRVRVTNAAGAPVEQFEVAWAGADGQPIGKPVSVYAPAGQSRVVRAPRPADVNINRLVLHGDDHAFDNTFYVAPLKQAEVTVAYVGSEPSDDPQGLHFYLSRAFPETPSRKVKVKAFKPDEAFLDVAENDPQLVVVTEPLAADRLDETKRYLRRGGAVVLVLKDEQSSQTLAALLDRDQLKATEARGGEYAMLSQIDFSHPVFAALSGPRYNDFTKIRFWKHRKLELEESDDLRVLARFDDGDPALLERRFERGRLLTLTSGWHPADSQLARSTKFVPMVSSILEQHGGAERAAPIYYVGDSIALDFAAAGQSVAAIVKPDGANLRVASAQKSFDGADQPGVYRAEDAAGAALYEFAVNVPASESDTAPLDVGRIEQYGVPLGKQSTLAEQAERDRQLRDTELETKQKFWRWLIVAAACVLIIETGLAGWLSRRQN